MSVEIRYFDELDSTNTYVRTHFEELADGTLVVAGRQTAGRGRRGRVWQSPSDTNIYASLTVKSLKNAFLSGTLCALGGLELVRELCPEAKSFIKWPNDIYVEDRKIAGILCESAGIADGRITGLAAGIGLNVNLDREAVNGIDQPATSLFLEAKRKFDVKKVTERLANLLNRYYIIGMQSEEALYLRWKAENRLIGQVIEVVGSRNERLRGVFRDIDPEGLLLLECEGTVRACHCGDVRIDRNSIDWTQISISQQGLKQ